MTEINQYRQELKDRIISYAMPEFYKRGVKAVKMDEISQGLHVSKRTVYEIFGDKEELLLAGMMGSPDISRGKVFLFYRKFIPLHHEQSRTISISTVDSAIRDTFKF